MTYMNLWNNHTKQKHYIMLQERYSWSIIMSDIIPTDSNSDQPKCISVKFCCVVLNKWKRREREESLVLCWTNENRKRKRRVSMLCCLIQQQWKLWTTPPPTHTHISEGWERTGRTNANRTRTINFWILISKFLDFKRGFLGYEDLVFLKEGRSDLILIV